MSFSADITRFIQRANGNIDRATREATVLLAQTVVTRSPVDTGRFRNNWQFSAAGIDRTISPGVDPQGQMTIKRLVLAIRKTGSGGITYLSNSLPYAVRLENGWSDQAPHGMVKLAAQEFQQHVSQAAKGSKK